ncbi:hypothetical protein [Anaerococcus porci]|uniref:hypothetical protein n=1 Tax=Anaerococcus porci TaxID=2652269 RepID=UPI002A755010|nr:hypothetical protein [Anaerococcus porci]MDY3006256.1 hypothetical protein [Anaerococcus porci]
MNKIKKISILFLIFILTSCSFGRPEDVTELIETPKIEDPILKGTWEVKEIKSTSNNKNSDKIKKGDILYIDNDLVALNDDYAYPPKFSSKYVDLNSYLQSRSIDKNIFDKDNVEVLSASQGELYSKDFIKLSNQEIFMIVDNAIIVFEKIDDNVSRSIVEKYAKRASKERTTTKSGKKVEGDICVLIGVRERIDTESSPNYYYYTYCVRIEPNKMARVGKAEHIYFPNKQEFWRLKCELNPQSKKYDSFKAYPIKLEKELSKKENQEKYKFINRDLDLKINFVNEDYISFDYNLVSDKSPINKYAMVKTDELKSNTFMTINEYAGDEKSKQVFKNLVYEQVNSNFGSVDEDKMAYDYTNFGLIRNLGLWQFQSSYHLERDGAIEQKSFPIDIALRENLIDQDNKEITVDQIKNLNYQAKDYFELVNGQYVVVQSPDEILFYHIKNGLIDTNPKFSIQLQNPSQIIMFEQGLGSYAEKWEDSFNANNVIIH